MIDIEAWIKEFTNKAEETFSDRVWFIGLQGSYARGDATEKSDIDVVFILDELRVNDLKIYSDMLDALPNRELVCDLQLGSKRPFSILLRYHTYKRNSRLLA